MLSKPQCGTGVPRTAFFILHLLHLVCSWEPSNSGMLFVRSPYATVNAGLCTFTTVTQRDLQPSPTSRGATTCKMPCLSRKQYKFEYRNLNICGNTFKIHIEIHLLPVHSFIRESPLGKLQIQPNTAL